MTMGVSFCYLPFFLISHQAAHYFGYATNGYTLPYRLGISIAALFYFGIALFYLTKLLLRYFDQVSTFWTILIIAVGTNIINYVTTEPGMSHVYSFFLITLFFYCTDNWYTSRNKKQLFYSGFLLGLITLIRPVNVIVIIPFLFWKISSFSALISRINMFLEQRKIIFKTVLFFSLPLIPQLLYWKYNSGSWLFYSYTDNEGFFFLNSKIIEGLLSFRKGWLIYTPLMILGLVGIIQLKNKLSPFRIGIILFSITCFYITFSWWCWWYGGSYGMRPLIDFYPIFSFPIAAFIHSYQRSLFLKTLFSTIILLLMTLNLFQHYQYRIGILHYDAMSKELYQKIWGMTEYPIGYVEAMDNPDYTKAKVGER